MNCNDQGSPSVSQPGVLGPLVPSKSIWVPAAVWQLLSKFKHSWGHSCVPGWLVPLGLWKPFGWQLFSGPVLWWCKWGVYVTKFKETLTLTVLQVPSQLPNTGFWKAFPGLFLSLLVLVRLTHSKDQAKNPYFIVFLTQSRKLPYPIFPHQQISFETLLDEGWEIIINSVKSKFKIRLCGIRDVLM